MRQHWRAADQNCRPGEPDQRRFFVRLHRLQIYISLLYVNFDRSATSFVMCWALGRDETILPRRARSGPKTLPFGLGDPSRKISEPRAHHFAPQCWLTGFTDTGRKDGRLFATDLKREKQWPSSPPNAGHQRDLYRISEDAPDPVAFRRSKEVSK